MSHRLLLTLFAALLMFCAGLSGAARAAVLTVAVVEQVSLTGGVGSDSAPTDPAGVPSEPRLALESGGAVELADMPLLLPDGAPALSLYAGQHRSPRPVLQNGHPAPCLDGLLRPPCLRA